MIEQEWLAFRKKDKTKLSELGAFHFAVCNSNLLSFLKQQFCMPEHLARKI